MSDYTHILVAIDFSPSSEQVLNTAREITARNNAHLSLLHVVEYLPPIDTAYEPIMVNNWVIDESEMIRQAKKSLQQFSDKQQLENAVLHTLSGTPKYEITQFVKAHQCDLVVLGSHGRHGIRLLLGSTANAVLHDMPCDVLAVKITE
ncbi:Universal stress protein family COG0589 [hydrothermal vent metagenome]|uniref:Universal stress protein family COG0589 n=1 Tax=hydrothermal vent metagenome TaxID=652676 RepID=A0A3B0WTQ7_9ZZZZ